MLGRKISSLQSLPAERAQITHLAVLLTEGHAAGRPTGRPAGGRAKPRALSYVTAFITTSHQWSLPMFSSNFSVRKTGLSATPRQARSARRHAFRAGFERLENRRVLTGMFQNLAGYLGSSLNQAQGALDGVVSASSFALPIVGTSISSFQKTIDNGFTAARNALVSAVNALDPTAQAAAMQQAIANALDAAGIQHDHVIVSNLDPTSGNVTIDVGLAKTVDLSKQGFNFNLGVPSLPFSVISSGGFQESLGVQYNNLRFGLNQNAFFLDTSPLNELKVSFDVTATPTSSVYADAGLFSVKATPLPTFGLHAGIAVDVGGKVAPSLTGGANADLALVGVVGSGTPVGNFKLPSIQANMLMDWQLGGANANPTVTNFANFGASAPTFRFQNVQVGLGEYLSDVLAPVTAAIQTYLTYYKPYLELINFKIPGLEDAFQAAGLGDATIMNIAKILADTKVIDDPLFETVEHYSELLTDLKAGFGDLINPNVSTLPSGTMVSLGNFDLSGNGDLRTAAPASPLAGFGNLTTLVAHATSAVQTLQNDLGGHVDLNGVQAFLRTLQTDISISFPFSDDPVHGAFAMLLGQDVPLVKFSVNLPSVFNVDLAKLMNQVGGPVLGRNNDLPATAALGGDLNIDVHLVGGYDTRGIRELIEGQGDAGVLADGFFLDSSEPVLSANGDLSISAGPKIGGTVTILGQSLGGEVGVEGRGDFHFDNLAVAFDDPNLDGDHTFRPFSAQDSGRNLFTATGSLSGSLSLGGYASVSIPVLGTKRVDVGPQIHVDLGTFIDFTSYNNSNPFRPVNVPAVTTLTAVYDFATSRPDLANDGRHDDLYAYVQNGKLIVSLNGIVGPLGGGTLLFSQPVQQNNSIITNLTVLGGQDGVTFHPILGPVQYKFIGQAVKNPGVSDVAQPGDAPVEQFTDALDVSDTGFGGTLVQADLGGTGAYGVSDLKLTTYYQNGTAPAVNDILYSNMTSLALDLSLTPADLVNINAASTIPVVLNLSNGNDTVNVEAGVTSDNLSQHYTIHGNGGNDTLTFRKSTATYVYSGVNRPIDTYTIDDGHLTYQTQQSVRPNPASIDIALTRTIQLDYDGIENVVVDQKVIQGAAFEIGPIGAGKTVTVHGPLPTSVLSLIPTVTYTLGGSNHNLDGYLGTLIIDDRALTGTLVLDDTADRQALATNSDMLGGTVQTNYQVSAGTLARTRTFSYYQPDTGSTSATTSFQIQEPNNGIAGVQVMAGGEYNSFDIGSLPNRATTLVGGPGYDTFTRHSSPLGFSTGTLTLNSNGGGDTFFYDDSPVTDTANASEVSNHNLTFALAFDTMTSGKLDVSDHNTGYTVGPFGSVDPFDWTPYEDVTFSGMGNIWVQGASGSHNTFAVTGNTSASLRIGTGPKTDLVTVTAGAPTSRRGALTVAGFNPTKVVIAGTLDFPAINISADSVTLDDSLSTIAHTYTVDTGAFTRDGVRFSLAVRGLYVKGGQGNDVFNLVQPAIETVANASTWLEGGAGNDTFTLAHNVVENGSSTPVRSLDGYASAYLVLDGGTGKNSVIADDSGSNGGHYYTIESGSLNIGDWAAGVTYLSRDYQRFLISENMSNVSLLAANGVFGTTTRIKSLPASLTFSATVQPSGVVYLGDIRSMTSQGFVLASTLDNILGAVEIHSTGSGPMVVIDDRASTTGRRFTIGPNGATSTISGFGTGRVSLIGFKPTYVDLYGSSASDIFTILGRVPGLRIDGGPGSGIDTLDYSSYTTAVTVDLVAGTATDIDRGITRIKKVIYPKS